MEFPNPIPLRVELAFGADPDGNESAWTWTDVTNDVFAQTVQIDRGRQDEMSQVQPSSCRFTLENREGKNTPGLPSSPYYPHIRLGTPVRVWMDWPDDVDTPVVVDNFDREIDGEWGTADTGQTWKLEPIQSAGSSWGCFGEGVAVTPAKSMRTVQLLDVNLHDYDMYITTSPRQVSTGGAVFTIIHFRYSTMLASSDVRVVWGSDGQVYGALHHIGNHVVRTPAKGAYDAWTEYRTRLRIDGTRHRFKLWPYDSPEPAAWDIDIALENRDFLNSSGRIALGISTEVPNTNASPGVNFDELVVRDREPRYFGFVSEWSPSWPHGDLEKISADGLGESLVDVVCSGLLRRLGQGAQPVASTMTRGTTTAPGVVAYWPCEDGPDATQLASAMPNGQPLVIWGGEVKPGQNSNFAASKPIPSFQGGQVGAPIAPYTATGVIQTGSFVDFTTSGIGTDANPATLQAFDTNNDQTWVLETSAAEDNDGWLRIRAWRTSTGAIIYDPGWTAWILKEKSLLVSGCSSDRTGVVSLPPFTAAISTTTATRSLTTLP